MQSKYEIEQSLNEFTKKLVIIHRLRHENIIRSEQELTLINNLYNYYNLRVKQLRDLLDRIGD